MSSCERGLKVCDPFGVSYSGRGTSILGARRARCTRFGRRPWLIPLFYSSVMLSRKRQLAGAGDWLLQCVATWVGDRKAAFLFRLGVARASMGGGCVAWRGALLCDFAWCLYRVSRTVAGWPAGPEESRGELP